MRELVERVKCTVVITLIDDTEIEISVGPQSNLDNYITSINILESTSTENQNPVGVVSSNILKVELKSNDRSLIPDNMDSEYYGMMNNTATIQITLTDEDGDVEFNPFFVSSWISNISASNPNQVIIEATDILGIINKNMVPDEEIMRSISTKDLLLETIDRLNSKLDNKHKIRYDANKISFNDFPYVSYTNINADNMGRWLNILSQSTLTNFYYTREGKLVTDYNLDDSAAESVCNLKDTVNILDARVDKGGLVGYTGVKVNYLYTQVKSTSELAVVNNKELVPGNNNISNINLGSNGVFKVKYIKVASDALSDINIVEFNYNKKVANIILNNASQNNVECNIYIYGQELEQTELFVEKNIIGNGSNEILEVTNKLLEESYIDLFAQNLLNLISIKNNTLNLTGFFNPRIKLGDIVYVDVERSINIKGYYKVIELKWKITDTIKCTAKVIKTINEVV